MVVQLHIMKDPETGAVTVATDIPGAGSAGIWNGVVTDIRPSLVDEEQVITIDLLELMKTVFTHLGYHIEGAQSVIRDQSAIIEEHGL